MPSITLKDLPPDLHGQLKRQAEANYRSLNQEALARLQRSFDVEDALTTQRDQRWIDQALASGPESRLTRQAFAAALKQGLERAKKRGKRHD